MLPSIPRLLTACIVLLLLNCENPSDARPVCATATDIPRDPDATSSLPCRKATSALLDFVTSVAVPSAERFTPAESFRKNQLSWQLQISWIGQNFSKQFLGKVERNVAAGALDIFSLRRSAHDDSILAELGGYPEVTLHDVWTLLDRQSQGQRGPLLTNSTPNIFYVRNSMGVVWAVDAVWGGAGWEIGASALDDLHPWQHGRQIISR